MTAHLIAIEDESFLCREIKYFVKFMIYKKERREQVKPQPDQIRMEKLKLHKSIFSVFIVSARQSE